MDGEKLTAKQERFCQEYIVDYNGTRAAVRAGYAEGSAGVTACKLLKKTNVAARVRELQEEYNEQHCFAEKSRVLAEAWDVFQIATDAKPVMVWDSAKHEYVENGEYQIDGKTATKSLELIAKMSGLLTEKVAVGADADSAGEVHFSIEVKKTGN